MTYPASVTTDGFRLISSPVLLQEAEPEPPARPPLPQGLQGTNERRDQVHMWAEPNYEVSFLFLLTSYIHLSMFIHNVCVCLWVCVCVCV